MFANSLKINSQRVNISVEENKSKPFTPDINVLIEKQLGIGFTQTRLAGYRHKHEDRGRRCRPTGLGNSYISLASQVGIMTAPQERSKFNSLSLRTLHANEDADFSSLNIKTYKGS